MSQKTCRERRISSVPRRIWLVKKVHGNMRLICYTLSLLGDERRFLLPRDGQTGEKKMKKRLLSLALALIVLTGLVPTAALADELPPEPTPAATEQPVPEITPAPVTPAPAQPAAEPAQPSAEPVQPSAEPTTPAQPQEPPATEPEEGESGVPSPSAKPEDDAEAEENEVEAEAEPSPSPSAAPQIAVHSSNGSYILRFLPNGGTGRMPDISVPFDEDFTLPLCTFEKRRLHFRPLECQCG